MSVPVDTFDEGLRKLKLGRQFNPDDPKAFGGLFSLVEPHADVLRDRLAEALGPSKFIPEILTGVNDDSTFNAVAVRLCATQYIIAVNYGTLILIHDLTHRLFCLPEFFPWVGDPSKEDLQRQFHPTSANAQTYMRIFLSDPRPVVPRDPQRQRAAQSLIHFVVMFLVAHEFRHIMGGHLAWLGSRSDRKSIAERPQADSSEGLSLQALEMDADSFAMYYTLLQALGVTEGPQEGLPTSLRSLISTPRQALEVALACAVVIIGTFFPPPGGPGGWRSRSHPPSGIRQGISQLGADRALQQLGHEDLRSATIGNLAWVAHYASFALRHLTQRLGNSDRQSELLLQFGPRGQQHLLEILKAWGEIRPAVASHAYMPVIAS